MNAIPALARPAVGQILESKTSPFAGLSDADLQVSLASQADMVWSFVTAGDLSALTAEQKTMVILAVCERAGLRAWPIPPIGIIKVKVSQKHPQTGKVEEVERETIYAFKEAAHQLIAARKLSIDIIDRREIPEREVYLVIAKATAPDGRTMEQTGVVGVAGLKAGDYANAVMKAETKAIRRAVLALCNIAILDESEMDTMRVGEPVVIQMPLDAPTKPSTGPLPSTPAPTPDVLPAGAKGGG